MTDNARTSLAAAFRELTAACNARPFGDPEQLGPSAAKVRDWAQARLEPESLRLAAGERLQLLRTLCDLPDKAYPSFESARLITATGEYGLVVSQGPGELAIWAPEGNKVTGTVKGTARAVGDMRRVLRSCT